MTKTSIDDLLKRQEESRLSIRDFCANEGIALSTFYYWKKRRTRSAVNPPESFIPLIIKNQAVHKKVKELTEFSSTSKQDPVVFEFAFPNGTRLTVKNPIDLTLLKSLIHMYD